MLILSIAKPLKNLLIFAFSEPQMRYSVLKNKKDIVLRPLELSDF